jgi:hypothetical protein
VLSCERFGVNFSAFSSEGEQWGYSRSHKYQCEKGTSVISAGDIRIFLTGILV